VEPALVSGRDYPNTYRGFVEMFPDDTACAAFLARLRWPGGFICPACKTDSIPWSASRGRLACPICRHQTSVSAGTIFDKTRTPLTTWFEATWHVTTAKNGMSAKTPPWAPAIELLGRCYSVFGWLWWTPNVNRYQATWR